MEQRAGARCALHRARAPWERAGERLAGDGSSLFNGTENGLKAIGEGSKRNVWIK